MGAYVFSEYVDTDLMGFDMQLEISAGLHGEVDSISFDFCGNTYDAKITGDTKCSALLTGWGGSGLKPLTANIVWNDGCETSVIIAYVNLLIDPSGVVYGIDNKPLENASVTLQVLKNGIWRDWDAEAYGQSNYLNTGKDGKYGWFVPAGTYRVLATAFGYEDYSSEPVYGNIQIPPPRMDIDIYMQPKAMTITTAASENGAIGVASSAHPGDIVTVSDLSGAASGYRLNSVSVVTQWGGVINVTSTGDGSYQFIMPMAAVTVKGNYVPMAEPEVSISQTGSDITATAENLNEDGILVIALYNKAGKQISVHFGKANSDSLTVAIGDAVRAKAFLLNNTDSFTPITGSGIWADITK